MVEDIGQDMDIEKFLCASVDIEDFFVCRHEDMDIVDIVYLVAWISRGFLSVVDYI